MTMDTIYVGDPIDVITGNQFDVALDFQIAWSFPFRWRRLYSVARRRERLALGWGHTHSYDHRLTHNIDGLQYVDPRGARYQFVVPRTGSPVSEVPGATLRLIGRDTYSVRTERHPRCDFRFVDPERPALLLRVYRGRAFHAFGYDRDGVWTTLSYANEPTLRIESEGGRILALIWTGQAGDRERPLWRGEYDAAGNLISVTDVRGGTQRLEYDSRRRMIRHTDRLGYAFIMAYDDADRCVRSSGEDGVQDVRLRFRPDEKRTLMTRADGGEWQYLYQKEGIAGILDPYGGITRKVYGEGGGLVEEIGPSGEPVRKLIDHESGVMASPFGPPEGPALPLGDPWFEAVSRRAKLSDPMDWDGFGTSVRRASIALPVSDRRWAVRLPAGVIHSLTFGAGPPDTGYPSLPGGRTGPAPKKPMFKPAPAGILQFDGFGTLTGHQLPDGKRCRWQYDANGNIIRYVDYERSEWQTEYASWNHRVAEIDPLGHKTAFEYNKLERLVGVSDPGGTRTEHAYDLKDRIARRARDGQPSDRFSYDLSDRLVQARRGDGEVRIRFEHGPHGRPVRVAPDGQPIREYEYDERGRLLTVTAAGEPVLRFGYDQFGAVTEDVQQGLGARRRFVGPRLVETAVLERFSIKYDRDPDLNSVTITDPTGRRHTVRRLDRGVFLLERCNGVREVSQYDWNGRCLARARYHGLEIYTVWSRTYRYSGIGTLLEAFNSQGGMLRYEYDMAHRLTAVIGPRGLLARFRMDEAGNVCSAPGLRQGVIQGNRLVSVDGHEVLYDDRGNMIEDRTGPRIARYNYDAESRLIAADAGGEQVAFTYDALGRRLSKTTSAGTTTFIWDGERLAAEEAFTGAFRVYVYADEKAMTPFLFVDYDSKDSDPADGRLRHLFTDQVSCPILVEDQETRVLWRARTSPYGGQTASGQSRLTLNLRWPGHYFDIETELHYNRHRYYSPRLCRYIQPDPFDIDGGVNVYAYPARPLDTVDLNGLAPCPKKAMIQADEETDDEYAQAKKCADETALRMKAALEEAFGIYREDPSDPDAEHWSVTMATMVVLDKDGNYQVVATSNCNPNALPASVRETFEGVPVVGWDDESRPPPVRQGDEDHRFPDPDKERDTTHRDAEQRGLRAVDCAKDANGDDQYQGVAYIAPTRSCCAGCSSAIQTPHSGDGTTGGWGGTNQNVSDVGRGPRLGNNYWDD